MSRHYHLWLSIAYLLLPDSVITIDDILSSTAGEASLVEEYCVDSYFRCDQMRYDALFSPYNDTVNNLMIDCYKRLSSHPNSELTRFRDNYYNVDLTDLDPLPRRKVELLLVPGNVLLPAHFFKKLATFALTMEHNLDQPLDDLCGGNIVNCHMSRNNEQYSEKLTAMKNYKQAWEKILNSGDKYKYLTNILPLVREEATIYDFPNDPEDYWNELAELKDAIQLSRTLWEEIKPLYSLLLKYVKTRKFVDGVDMLTPEHLGSLVGDDWSEIARYVMPKDGSESFSKIQNQILKQGIGGKTAFMGAEQLLDDLGFGKVSDSFWSNSSFDSNRPNRLVRKWFTAVRTSNVPSVSQFCDAYEQYANVLHEQIVGNHSRNTYIFKYPQRNSPIYKAIGGIYELAGWSSNNLQRLNILNWDEYNDEAKRVILLIHALRDLPRLAYTHCIDDWRLKNLRGMKIDYKDHMADCMEISTGEKDYLGDLNVLWNEPEVGEFLGLVLKYQVFNKFMQEITSDDVLEVFTANRENLINIMGSAYTQPWPQLIENFARGDESINSNGILEHFQVLQEYLEDELKKEYDENAEDIPEESFKEEESFMEPEEVRIPEENADVIAAFPEKTLEHNSPIRERKNTTMDETPASAQPSTVTSYTPYIWIAVGLALALLLILTLVIINRRRAHRRSIERERIASS